jgi:ABC-type branched-subunit amino acid transport system permease subunit
MAGIPYPELGMGIEMTPGRYYYLVFAFAVVCIYIMYRIVNSHYGYALRGIHDNEKRMQALGYNTWLYKYTSWVIAGTFGGVAGVFFAYFGGVMPRQHGYGMTDIGFIVISRASIYLGPIVGASWGVEYRQLYLLTAGRSSWAPSWSRSWSSPEIGVLLLPFRRCMAFLRHRACRCTLEDWRRSRTCRSLSSRAREWR